MADQVDEVKSKVDIVSLISEHIELKKAGRNFKALCPFHSEKSPSFIVSPELQIYKCFGCFPAGQLVKTPFGYHRIEDVVEGEFVQSGTGEIRRVLVKHERLYRGDLVTIKLSQLTEPVSLTADHEVFTIGGARMYKSCYKYLSKRLNFYKKYPRQKRLEKIWKYFPIEKISAGSLSKGMTLVYPVDRTVTDVKVLDLSKYITKIWPPHGTKPLIPPLDVKVDENLLKLIGYYIAEGSGHRAYIRFSLGNHEEDFAKEIAGLIKEIFGLEAKVYKRVNKSKTGLEITTCNSILANIFENLCGKGAERKHIPFIFQQLPMNKQSILLNAILKGDGHTVDLNKRTKTKRLVVTSVSKVLSEQLTDILLRTGYFPSLTVGKEKYDKLSVHHKKSYILSWSTNPGVSKFHHFYKTKDGHTYWLLPILESTKKYFSGRVYNLTVEKDHSYIANTFAVANCGESGDVFSFLEKYEGMEFYEALKFLADQAGVVLKSGRPDLQNKKEKIFEINANAVRFYNYLLLNHAVGKRALSYLTTDRGMKMDTIKTFNLGFAPVDPRAIRSFFIDKKKYAYEDLEQAGIVYFRNRLAIDRFSGRIIFPLHDHRGNCVGFAGRILPENDTGEIAKYINTPETDCYHKGKLLYGLNITKKDIKEEKEAIVVEGEIDLISSWQAGVRNVIAIKGSALTEDQLRLLYRFTQKITLALDSDFAGNEAAKRGILNAQDLGLEIRVSDLGEFKDPDDAARNNPRKFKECLKKSVGVWDFLIKEIFDRYKGSTGTDKEKISREVVPTLLLITDNIVQAHYINLVAGRLGVPVEAVSEQVERKRDTKKIRSIEPRISQTKTKSIEELSEEALLRLCFAKNPKMLINPEMSSLITTPFAKRMIEELALFFQKEKKFDPSSFSQRLPKELVDGYVEITLKDVRPQSEDGLAKEIDFIKKRLKIIKIKKRQKELEKEIQGFEKRKDEKRLIGAETEYKDLSQKLKELEEENGKGIIL